MSSRKKVVIGMSGGVDSSVAAWLLKQQGYEVIGLFMKNWEDDDDDEYCSTRQDWIDAVSVADVLGIDIEAVNFATEYKDRVFAEFLREYQAGRTPNPDVLCNAEIKFKAFLDHALQLGADHIATGHYARVREVGAAFQLLKAIDTSKDQSYFLHRLNQAQLSKTLFPLGEIHKTEVRQIAARLNLPNARKKDSTGICFIGERPFREFLNRYLSYQAGPMKTAAGDIVGQHVGLSFYTLGQRKGIGLGGLKAHRSGDGDSAPWYVAGKDMASNTLYVVQGHDHPWLLADALTARQASWIAGTAPVSAQLSAKTRYRQADVACRFAVGDDASFRLDFDNPQWAVTPGQSAVLYDGEVCLGGGVIDSAEAAAVHNGRNGSHERKPRRASRDTTQFQARHPHGVKSWKLFCGAIKTLAKCKQIANNLNTNCSHLQKRYASMQQVIPPETALAQAATAPAAKPAVASVRIKSQDLFQQRREVEIDHEGRIYRLRLTQLNKLILTA